MKKNIFVVGMDNFHLNQLQALKDADEYRFHSLMSYEKIKCGKTFPVVELLHRADKIFQRFNGSVDAIIGYWDFPVSTSLPAIRAKVGHKGPSLSAVLKCEHKYWSRLLQQEVVPDMIPHFSKIDPFSENTDCCVLPYPFWLKPVKAVLSHLGFLITNREDFFVALEITRKHIGRYAEPFNIFLNQIELPEEIRGIDGYHCIAESLISQGLQCTLEGYVHEGEVHVYGVVDSIREGEYHSSFARYQYPSTLPTHIRQRMIDATKRVLTKIGYDNSPFNIEFYWEEETGSISLLEINTRISKSHSLLFKMVDGEFHHKVMIDVALMRSPDFPYREGQYKHAAKFMLRCFNDGRVLKVPDQIAIAGIKERFPGTEISIDISEGMRLSDLRDQDSYSFEIGTLFMGADTTSELLENYQTALTMLPFNIENIED